MGVVEDSEQKQAPIGIKHYCRVCNRGFGCAGGLGGHMRTHGVGGDAHYQRNEEKGMSSINRNKPEGRKHSYFLRTNTNRFLNHRAGGDGDDNSPIRPHDGRGKCTLVDGFSRPSTGDGMMLKFRKAEEIENRDESNCSATREEQDLANCLVMLSNDSFMNKEETKIAKEVEKGMFQCKACKKFFSSHQALGGHRASHKKVKGCYAARITNLDEDDSIEDDSIKQEEILLGSTSYSSEPGFDHHDSSSDHEIRQNRATKSKSRDHQCSICQRVFTSGQALGGHKRCHWLTSNNLPDTTILQNLRDRFQFDSPTESFKKQMYTKTTDQTLDLNFPPVVDSNTNSLSNPFNYEAPARIFLQLWGSGYNDQLQQHRQRVHEPLHGFNTLEESGKTE